MTLTREEIEKKIWIRFKDQHLDKDRETLISLYDHLTRRIAKIWACKSRSAEEDDFVGIARFGLLKAVDAYDLARNVPFETFARRLMTIEIFAFLRKEDVLSPYSRRRVNALANASNRLLAQGSPLTSASLSSEMKVSEDQINKIRRDALFLSPSSIDLIGESEMTDSSVIDIDKIALQSELRDRLTQAFKYISPEDRDAILLRYRENLTYREIGERLGLKTSQVAYRHNRGLSRMRRSLFDLR